MSNRTYPLQRKTTVFVSDDGYAPPTRGNQPTGLGCLMMPVGFVVLVLVGYILLSLALKGLFN